jgi:predicted transcriptional regulator
MDPKLFLDARSVANDDISSYYKKSLLGVITKNKYEIVSKFENARLSSRGKKVSDIAKDLDVSLSTVNRYKHDIGCQSNRKRINRTSEQQREITLKGLATRRRNQEFKAEVSALSQQELTHQEFEKELSVIKDKYKKSDNGSTNKNKRGGYSEDVEIETTSTTNTEVTDTASLNKSNKKDKRGGYLGDQETNVAFKPLLTRTPLKELDHAQKQLTSDEILDKFV